MKKFKKIPSFYYFFIYPSIHIKYGHITMAPPPILNLKLSLNVGFFSQVCTKFHIEMAVTVRFEVYMYEAKRVLRPPGPQTTFLRTFDFSFSWLEEARRWNYLKWKIFLICSGKSLFLLFKKILKVAFDLKKDSSNHILEFLRHLICSNNFKFDELSNAYLI